MCKFFPNFVRSEHKLNGGIHRRDLAIITPYGACVLHMETACRNMHVSVGDLCDSTCTDRQLLDKLCHNYFFLFNAAFTIQENWAEENWRLFKKLYKCPLIVRWNQSWRLKVMLVLFDLKKVTCACALVNIKYNKKFNLVAHFPI